ncbi:MAG: class I SAM-dependent methyltransferase, partial [Acidimicrobiia bacterium]|nr:class I SAM-dependent methyltransferase [Acidimicrobiia bacterium]
MTRHLRRHKDFSVELKVTNDDFIRPPRDAQRHWLINRAVEELVDQLEHLDDQARDFVSGSDVVRFQDRTQAELGDQDLMEDWQIPVMRAMARLATASHGDVLEVGFGRGVSADFIQSAGVRSHTIVECNDAVVRRFDTWRDGHSDRDIRLLHGRWQDVTDQFGEYDAIFFHTYPLTEDEYVDQVVRSVTFAEHFFP